MMFEKVYAPLISILPHHLAAILTKVAIYRNNYFNFVIFTTLGPCLSKNNNMFLNLWQGITLNRSIFHLVAVEHCGLFYERNNNHDERIDFT